MGKLISSINITPDGFCNHADVIADEEHHKFSIGQMKTTDMVIFGRTTYQLFESFWPKAASDTTLPEWIREFGQYIDAVQKTVYSKTLKEVNWKNTQILPEIDPDYISKLKLETEKDILIYGSPTIISELSGLDLIDEYNFLLQPIISGTGKRIPANISTEMCHNLELKSSEKFSSGVLNLSYGKVIS
ncbi:dihydrofolate reductase family protein [Belliella marina]|uniref:Dihydrofolate reductase family protein n=1 Tax=Belliella marina TaxID=1644146 RepID=A0ABW4VTZ6_9BACT